jgi:regulator of replication initiation timing
MNEKKTIGILGLSVAFISICLLLLATWLYFFFRNTGSSNTSYQLPDTKQNTTAAKKVPEPDAAAVQNIRDSLQQLYTITTKDLDSQIDSTRSNLDTLKSHLDTKLSESAGLRSEILDILKNNNSGSEGMELARLKITMLQQKVNELRRINSDVEVENRRLRLLLNQVGNQATQDRNPTLSISNPAEKNGTETNTGNQPLSISDLRLTAMQLDEDREKETTQALQADRFVGSFMVKNNPAKAGNAEIVVVVLQPDGQVLQNSTWESGTFETREGKRVYSLKVRCENAKDAASPYRFYLNAERFQKGNYTMQIYQNGNVIGRLVKTLS